MATPETVSTASPTMLSTPRGIGTAVLSTVLSAFPVFVLASLAPLLVLEMGLDEAAIGGIVAAYFLTSAVFSVQGGRASDRFTWPRVVIWGGVATAAVVVVGAGVAQRLSHLVVVAALAGLANGLTQPAATEVLAVAVPPQRRGPAFGAKHAAVPTASLLAGLSIPTLALTVGWRWTFASVALLLVPLFAVVPRAAAGPTRRMPRTRAGRRTADRWLVLTAAGAGLATAAANGLAAYMVVAAVEVGIALGSAGLLLSACSVACFGMRLLSGFVGAGRGGQLPRVVALVGGGTAGYVLLATSAGSPPRFAVGALLAFAAGWGWSALLGFWVVRDNPDATATATGVLHVGTFTGGVVGPVVMGTVVSAVSFTAAWGLAAGLSALSVCCFATVWWHRARSVP